MTHKLLNLSGLAAEKVVPKAVDAKKKVKWAWLNGKENSIKGSFDAMREAFISNSQSEKSEKGSQFIRGSIAVMEFGSSVFLLRALKEIKQQRLAAEGASNMILYALSAEMARNPALLSKVEGLKKKFVYVDAQGKVFFTDLPGKNRFLVSRLMHLMGTPFTETMHNGAKTMINFEGLNMQIFSPATKTEVKINHKDITNAAITKNGAGKDVVTFQTPGGNYTFEIVGEPKANIKGWLGIK